MQGKSTKRSVAMLQGEKNTSLFYVLGQRQRSFLWRRHCINSPELFYKVVEEQQCEAAVRRGSKYPQQAAVLEDPPKAVRHPTTE